MRIMAISDMHTHNDDLVIQTRRFCNAVYREKPDILILNGDIFDPWVAHWTDICQTVSYQLLDDLTKWVRVRSIYINRNHDYNAPVWVLPSAERCGSFRSGVWEFMHGWEFSMDWSVFGPALFWLSVHCPGLMIPLHRAFIGPHVPVSGPHDKRQDWTLATGLAHARARLYAQKHGVNLCIGHYHCPSVFDGLITDGGDFVDSFSYVIIPDDAKPVAELRKL